MALNNIARQHYEDAKAHANRANTANDQNAALVEISLGQLSMTMAEFAVKNHALVMGVDEYLPEPPPVRHPTPTSGPKFWGAP